jgi:hypothetical protein
MQRSTSTTKGIADQGAKKLPLFWIVVLICMASLLIMVAVLQYRWTKQLSVATEARIGSTLQPLMIGWHLDLYGELSEICVALQVGPDSGARDSWNDYLRRYVEWSHAPTNDESVENIYANPDLIKNIYIYEARYQAHRLRVSISKRRKLRFPAYQDLQPLLARLRTKSSISQLVCGLGNPRLQQPKRAPETTAGSRRTCEAADKTTGWQFDKNVPAMFTQS